LLNPNEKDCGLPDSKKPSIRKKYGFPKTARLLKKSDFEATFKVGAKGVSKALVIYVKKNGLDWNRLGLVVSKKNGNAVKRNRIKRLIRAVFRIEKYTVPQGFDLVCIPRPRGFPWNFADLTPLFLKTVLRALKEIEAHDMRAAKIGREKQE